MINIETIVKTINGFLKNNMRKPATILPAILMVCSLVKRPGLSCIISTSNIIQSLSEKGIPTENLPDGTPNLMNQLVQSITCELIRALKEDANIQVALQPGSIVVNAAGANAGGPVTVVGTNINYPKGVANLS